MPKRKKHRITAPAQYAGSGGGRKPRSRAGVGDHAEESSAEMGVTPPVLVATWRAGLFVVAGGTPQQELADHSVRAIAPDGHGSALAIVDGRSLCRRAPRGVWSTIATAEMNLACCVAVDDIIYAGTDDALVLRVSAAGEIEQVRGFERVAGRDKWYAGSALIDDKRVGPPLGVRSITATSDGTVLLANVHVGGIPRSADGGETWQPTIDIDSDVHEVRAHPSRPGIVAAAAAVGLCTSSDGGATWEVEQRGLHALHCSAVAFAGDDVLVSAAVGPFAPRARSIDGGWTNMVRSFGSRAVCPRGSMAKPILVAFQRMVRRSRSPICRATSTYQETMAAAGRVARKAFQLQAAS